MLTSRHFCERHVRKILLAQGLLDCSRLHDNDLPVMPVHCTSAREESRLKEKERCSASRDTPNILQKITFRSVTARNRIAFSPMCQYSAMDGISEDWHLVHPGACAVGGAGMVSTEATHIESRGRVMPCYLGLWNNTRAQAFARSARFNEDRGAVPAKQLHAPMKWPVQYERSRIHY